MSIAKPINISGVIITLNEEQNIERCLKSLLPVCDEIIVIDSGSSDKTEEICKKHKVNFIHQDFLGYTNQKNFAIDQAKYDYILSLDADESLSDELTTEILKIKSNWLFDGYEMNRLTNYCGQWVHHTGWYPDRKIRLFKRDKARWKGGALHEKMTMNDGASLTRINGNLLHYSYYTIDDHLKQIEKFTKIASKELHEKGYKPGKLKVVFSGPVRFIRDFFVKRGFLDGYTGFRIALISSFATYLKYARVKELVEQDKTNKKTRIIISRTDSIGDVILTLPMAGFLKKKYPKSEIIFLGRNYTKEIISNSKFIDEFINFDEIECLSENHQIEALQKINADIIVHVFPVKKIVKLAHKAGIKKRIGNIHRWYNVIYCNKWVEFSRRQSNLHEAQLNVKLLSPLGIRYNDISLGDYAEMTGFMPKSDHNKTVESFISNDKFNLILHPKSKGSAREWELENYKNLIDILPENKFNIILSGTEDEGEMFGKKLLQNSKSNLFDSSGKLTLAELILMISKADALLACSTGPLHIAAICNIHNIGIYPPMKPMHPGRWKPIGKKTKIFVKDIKCNDCRNTKQCACVNSISPEEIRDYLLMVKALSL